MSNAGAPARNKATRREWIGLAVLALPCVLYSMDLTVLYLAVPYLSADIQPTSSQLLWIIDIYGFFVAASLITMGTLGDRIGRRRLLMIGAGAFGLASVLAAFSNSAEMLIIARAILGIAGATLAPSTLSLIRNMFPDSGERTFAIGVWATSYSVGGMIGPLLGGLMLEYFWWGSVFLLGVPVMVLLLIVGPLLLPEYRDHHSGKIDLFSAFLSLVAVLAAIYGVKNIAAHGPGWIAALSIASGLVIGALFLMRQRKLEDPFIDLNLFRSKTFSTSLVINLLGLFIAFGSFLFVGQYLQLVLGLSPLEAGLWMLPSSFGFIAGSLLAPVFVRHLRKAVVMCAGLTLTAIGFALLAFAHGPQALGVIISATFIYAFGIAPVITLTTDLIVGSAPPSRAGSAAAISETGAEFGGALGIAILGSIFTAIYRGIMIDAIPEGTPAMAAAAARSTLGGAVGAARDLPDLAGALLLNHARDAFVDAFEFTVIVCALIALAAAVLAALMFRHTRAGEVTEADTKIANDAMVS